MPTSGFEPLTSPLQVGRDNHYTKRAHLSDGPRYFDCKITKKMNFTVSLWSHIFCDLIGTLSEFDVSYNILRIS